MKIIIVGQSFGFPNGTGAVSRVRAYGTGLRAAGADVQVLCLKPTEPPTGEVLNPAASGALDGVEFQYACGTSRRVTSKLGNAVLYLRGLVTTSILIRRAAGGQEPCVVYALLCDDPVYMAYLWAVTRWGRPLLVGERSEFPLVYSGSGARVNMVRWLNDHFMYALFDGLVVISTMLETHFRKLLGNEMPVLRVPILVDVNRSRGHENAITAEAKSVVFVGNLDHDGEVECLIEAFSIAVQEKSDWQLEIIGPGQPHRLEALQTLCARTGNAGRITFSGEITADEVATKLRQASILALSRPWGVFSEAGFPTKLAEYLASGNPVVVTATGDIHLFLEDGVSAFLVHDSGATAFAAKLSYVMDHPDEAARVGRTGRGVAVANFDAQSQCRRLVEWIENLMARRAQRQGEHAR